MTTRPGYPAVFYRGGSSKAIVFKATDLPENTAKRNAIFLQALGSPDPYQRQLNGMGGGLSSLSKVVIVERSNRSDADIDYTFVQVSVDKPVADYGQMCGNMSSSVGPFALEEGLISLPDGDARVSIYNTNTNKIFHAQFEVRNGRAVETGDFVIPGVAGSGSRVVLDYIDPGGAATSGLLPSGSVVDSLDIPGRGAIDVSLIDATNPVVFVRATDLGLHGTEQPEALESDTKFMDHMELIRRAAGVKMGMAYDTDTIALSNPKVAIVSRPVAFVAIDGTSYNNDSHDIAIRIVSMGRVHRAVTLTGAMCLGAATQISGSIPGELSGEQELNTIRIGNPSGVLPVQAQVGKTPDGSYIVLRTTSFRTQRRLMEGRVLVDLQV